MFSRSLTSQDRSLPHGKDDKGPLGRFRAPSWLSLARNTHRKVAPPIRPMPQWGVTQQTCNLPLFLYRQLWDLGK
jgi:hypothetical protein